MYSPTNFLERKPKILLSGNLAGYPMRIAISTAVNATGASVKGHVVAKKYYEVLNFIGYGNVNLDNCKLTGLGAYYNILSDYQGAFVGYFKNHSTIYFGKF